MKEKNPFPLIFLYFDLVGLIKVGFVLRERAVFQQLEFLLLY